MPEKYYHVKPKSKTRLSYGRVSVDELDDVKPSGPRLQIMDLAFVGAQPSRARTAAVPRANSLLWLKLIILGVVSALIYTGGAFMYQNASQIKADTINTVNQATAKLEAAAQAATLNNLPEARNQLIASENLFATAQRDILSLGQTNLYMSGLASDRFKIVAGQKIIDAGLNLAQGGQLLIATAEPALQYFNTTTVQQGDTQAQDFLPQLSQMLSASSRNLDKALLKVGKADKLLQSVPSDTMGSNYALLLASAQAKASDLYSAVAMMDTLSKQLPRALGEPNPRSYLILNQNDTELRPTGGFMGSVAILKLHHSKITEFYTDDTYRIDGQLAASQTGEKVIPNANFDPDFPTSARYISNLYEQAGGGTPDGVIAINTQVMTAMMKVIGNIELKDRKLTLTPDNFAQVVYGEIQKVEKTSNPKAILSEISPILQQKLTSLSREQLNQLTPLLIEQIAKKNLMLYSRNTDLQNILSNTNLAGELQPTNPKQDYLMVARANMGFFKSSYSVQDSIIQQVSVSSIGDITEKLTLTYTHTGQPKPPDGTNKDYVRVYLPKGTVVKNIIGYDMSEKVVTEPAHDKTFFGFYVTTEPQTTKTVTLEYQLPFKLDLAKGEKYTGYIQKQSGTTNTTLTSTIALPSTGLNVSNSAKELFKGSLLKDISF